MTIVPHDLLVNAAAPIGLENKVRRMIRALNQEPTNSSVIQMTNMLRDAFEGAYGRSNLTDWRITTEWPDMVAFAALDSLVRRSPRLTARIDGTVTPKGKVTRWDSESESEFRT